MKMGQQKSKKKGQAGQAGQAGQTALATGGSRGRGKLSAVSASKRERGAAISGSWHKSWP